MFCLGFTTLFFTFWVFHCVGCNLFLDELSIPNIEEHTGDTKIKDIIFVTVAVLLLILGIVLIFIKPDGPTENPWAKAYENNLNNGVQGRFFEVVPKVVQKNAPKHKSLCYDWNLKTYPITSLDSASSSGLSKPGFRVAILARNSTIKSNNLLAPRAKMGNKEARTVFFPNQNSSNDDWILFYGTEDEINNFL